MWNAWISVIGTTVHLMRVTYAPMSCVYTDRRNIITALVRDVTMLQTDLMLSIYIASTSINTSLYQKVCIPYKYITIPESMYTL